MHKTATIRNYNADTTEVVIEEFENVSAIFVCVISGDEVLNVIYKDGRTERFDSSNDRITTITMAVITYPLINWMNFPIAIKHLLTYIDFIDLD